MDQIDLAHATLVVARLINGLLAGSYLAFSIAVMPALRGLDDAQFVAAMNRINQVIVNPAFLVLFVGAPLSTFVLLRFEHGPLAWIAAGAALAAVALTIVVNVPLNDALAADGDRSAFENPWTAWHTIRTAATVIAFAAVCAIQLDPGRSQAG